MVRSGPRASVSICIVTIGLASLWPAAVALAETTSDHPAVSWGDEEEDAIEVSVSTPATVTPGSRQRGSTSGPDPAPSGPVVPSGSRPVVPQSAQIDYGAMLPDCGVGITAATAQISCWDPVTREAFYVPPEPDEEPEPDDQDQDQSPAPDPPTITGAEISAAIRAHTSTQIEPAPLIIQPDQDWHLVNLPVIVRTEALTQDFSTDLLGLAVDIRAEPVSYTWDFGDHTPVLNTTEPGAPYPEHTLEHTYTHSGTYQITLTTYWSGTFRIQNGPWIPIDGLGLTTTTSPNLDLQTRTTRLTG